MNVLILGGHGYIGSRLFNFLKEKGIDVDAYGSKTQDYNDLTSSYLNNFDFIVLLAGHSSVPSCNGDLKSPWNNNVRNFSNLIEKTNLKHKIIYASSSSVYGNTGDKPATENVICSSYVNNYDLTKTVLDHIAQNYIYSGKNIIGLRFGTVNGASPVIRTDLLINSMTYSAVNTGNIYITNRNIYRPFLDISDLINAIFSIINKNFVSGIYNLATENKKIIEYATIVSKFSKANIIDNGTTLGAYDFTISSEKFLKTFDFTLTGNVENLVNDLIYCYKTKSSKLVSRNEYFHYTS